MARQYAAASLLVGLLGLGCTASIGVDGAGPSPTGVTGPGDGVAGSAGGPGSEPSQWQPGVAGDVKAAGYMPLRQLNRIEYRNAVAELLGDTQQVDELLPGDVAGTSGFATAGLASEVTAQALQQAAERLAAAADVASLTDCALSAGSVTCIETLLQGFAQRAFRRPLTDAERAEYVTLFTTLSTEVGLSFEGSARGVVEALLQSPGFLYHWELGPNAPVRDADGVIQLAGYEVASRLSFLLWSSIPDQELLTSAASGALNTVDGVEAQARRLLASDKAQATMSNFHLQWLEVALQGITKSSELYPSFGPSLAGDMEGELALLSADLYRNGGTARDLFQTDQAFVSADLALLYGLPAAAPGGLVKQALPSGSRPGILTRAGFLTATSNAYEGDPTKRGVVIRKRVLCDTLTPPPANVPALPAPAPNLTVRERHAMHMEVEPCKSCHTLTDPIGFGLGNFDAVGAYRTQEAGKQIDASGSIVGLDDANPTFNDAAGLMALLAESQDVRSCLTRQWLRFGFARQETRADDHSLESAYQAFQTSGFTLSELLVALTKSRSFRYRAPAPGEVIR